MSNSNTKLQLIKKDDDKYEFFFKNYLNKESLTESKKSFVKKILFLESSFETPEKKPILEIINMLCSEEGQDILYNNPKFGNYEMRNFSDYTDYFDYDDFPDVFDRRDEIFGKSIKPTYPNEDSEQHAFCHYLTVTSKSPHYWDEEKKKIEHGISKKCKNKDLGMIIYCNYLTSTQKNIYHWNIDQQKVEYFEKNKINNNEKKFEYFEKNKLFPINTIKDIIYGGIGGLIISVPIILLKSYLFY